MAKVIIVDETGQRHVFPEGFDPKKAAGIVRAQLGTAETQKAEALRPKSIGDMNLSQVGEAAKQLGSMASDVRGVAAGAGGRALDVAKGLVPGILQSVQHPIRAAGNIAKYAVTEPVRIGEQLGQGTPEALGQSAVDAAMYIPAIMSGGRALAGPVTSAAGAVGSAAKAAAKSPITRGIGEAALYTPGVGPMIRGGIRGAARAMKKPAVAAETPLLSPEADALRASTEITGPETTALPDRGRSAMPPAQQPAILDVPKSARDRRLLAQEEASTALREASDMTPAPALQHDSQAIKDIMNPDSQAIQEKMFREANPVFRQMQKAGDFGERGTMEAEMAERAARESQTADLARGSRLTPKPQAAQSAVDEGMLNSMEVVEPTADVNTLGSKLGQVPTSQGRGIDPEVEALVEQLRARNQPQPVSSVPSHVGGHQTEAVPGAARTARSVYEPGGSQALSEDELMQLLYDIEQNRRP